MISSIQTFTFCLQYFPWKRKTKTFLIKDLFSQFIHAELLYHITTVTRIFRKFLHHYCCTILCLQHTIPRNQLVQVYTINNKTFVKLESFLDAPSYSIIIR